MPKCYSCGVEKSKARFKMCGAELRAMGKNSFFDNSTVHAFPVSEQRKKMVRRLRQTMYYGSYA